MYTYSGRVVFPKVNKYGLESTDGPSVDDIAVALGRIPRFAGHTRHRHPYPVLAHVLVCSQVIVPGMAVYALLHDAPEACVSDVPTPWKSEQAEANEVDLLERISKEHGLQWPWPQEVIDAVAEVDSRVLSAETTALGYPGPTDWLKHPVEEDIVQLTRDWHQGASRMAEPEFAISLFRSHFYRALERVHADG